MRERFGAQIDRRIASRINGSLQFLDGESYTGGQSNGEVLSLRHFLPLQADEIGPGGGDTDPVQRQSRGLPDTHGGSAKRAFICAGQGVSQFTKDS